MPSQMNAIDLSEVVDAVQRTVRDRVREVSALTLHLRFQAERGADGSVRLRSASADELVAQQVELRILDSPTPSGPEVPVERAVATKAAVSAAGEAVTGGDPSLLRRRLELVLGGGPGFNTGAKAEVLADLMEEYGRPALVEILRREWVSQFDTGPEASHAVLKVPAGSSGTQL